MTHVFIYMSIVLKDQKKNNIEVTMKHIGINRKCLLL